VTDTKTVEITLIHANGKVWGAQVPLETEWRDIRMPLSELRYFTHWDNLSPESRPAILPFERRDDF
jgi:hypothetical protein